MRTAFWISAGLLLLGVAQSNVPSQTDPANAQMPTTSVERGEYIVHRLAMCVQCHSTRTRTGALEPGGLLQGGPMPVGSPFPGEVWAFETPKLAGLPAGFTEEEFVRFLQTGDTGRGRAPRPPMPPFRMTEDDARAVAAYLKSLNPSF